MSEVAAVLMVLGAAFCVLATLGILRFPDVYTRLHAASKAGPLGAGLILLSAAFASGDPMIGVRSAMGFLFLVATSPVSAHLLARAALMVGIFPVSITSISEFEDSR